MSMNKAQFAGMFAMISVSGHISETVAVLSGAFWVIVGLLFWILEE